MALNSLQPETVFWAVFYIMLFSTLGFVVLMFRQQKHRRLYHYITITITITSALAYFAMADGLGVAKIEVPPKNQDSEPTYRSFYYARSIDLVITSPLIVLELGLLAGLDLVTIGLLLVANVYMVVAELVSTSAGSYHNIARWGFFVTGCLIYVYQAFVLLTAGRASASTHSPRVLRLFFSLTIYILVLWLLYPIVWALSEGSEQISEGVETLSYAVIDVLSKAVFGFWILLAHDQIHLLPVHRDGADESERARLNQGGTYGAVGNH